MRHRPVGGFLTGQVDDIPAGQMAIRTFILLSPGCAHGILESEEAAVLLQFSFFSPCQGAFTRMR